MPCNSNTVQFALNNWRATPNLFGQDRPSLMNVPLTSMEGHPAKSGAGVDVDRGGGTSSNPSADANQLLQELAGLYQIVCTAYERHRYLQAIVRPFLSRTTWIEAVEVARNGKQALPTEAHEVSILRLDIANFTELLDNHSLDQILTTLNAFLDRMTQLIYRHHGDVDKFLGDGFLSIFDDAGHAVEAGCAIQKAAADFNRSQSAKGRFAFPTRVAIDTGRVIISSLGSPDRRDRTVIGMPVNLAERLQAQATPGRVWFSQETFDRLRDQTDCYCLGPVKVKGRQKPITVYEKREGA